MNDGVAAAHDDVGAEHSGRTDRQELCATQILIRRVTYWTHQSDARQTTHDALLGRRSIIANVTAIYWQRPGTALQTKRRRRVLSLSIPLHAGRRPPVTFGIVHHKHSSYTTSIMTAGLYTDRWLANLAARFTRIVKSNIESSTISFPTSCIRKSSYSARISRIKKRLMLTPCRHHPPSKMHCAVWCRR